LPFAMSEGFSRTVERPARTGELCTCGRGARVVFITENWGEVGWCGISDGGDKGPCLFCGDAAGHDGLRCPNYRLRLDFRTAGVQEDGR
jgi:hypothetical protein